MAQTRTRRHMWVEFAVGSLLCSERFFSGYSGFPLSSKTNISLVPIRSLNTRTFLNEFCELLSAPWVNKLHLHSHFLHVEHTMCGFIAQLVDHRTGIADVTGSNPVEALIFFRLLLSNCINWKIYCDDHSSLSQYKVSKIESFDE